jgi:hypothetical protein
MTLQGSFLDEVGLAGKYEAPGPCRGPRAGMSPPPRHPVLGHRGVLRVVGSHSNDARMTRCPFALAALALLHHAWGHARARRAAATAGQLRARRAPRTIADGPSVPKPLDQEIAGSNPSSPAPRPVGGSRRIDHNTCGGTGSPPPNGARTAVPENQAHSF